MHRGVRRRGAARAAARSRQVPASIVPYPPASPGASETPSHVPAGMVRFTDPPRPPPSAPASAALAVPAPPVLALAALAPVPAVPLPAPVPLAGSGRRVYRG